MIFTRRDHCLDSRVAVLEALLKEREKELEKAFGSAQRAIDKAEGTVTSRLEGFPQIYMTRAEANIAIKALEKAVAEMREKHLDKDYYYREHQSLKESGEREAGALAQRLARLEGLAARFAGGLIVVAAIGIANVIKLFWGGG